MANETGYIKYITNEEFLRVEQFVDAIESPSMRHCYYMLMYVGIRTSEAISLRRSDFDQGFTRVRFRLKKRKGNHITERKIPSFLSARLHTYYQTYHHMMVDGHLFFSTWRNQSKNPHLTRTTIRYKAQQMRQALGMEDTYFRRKDSKELHRLSPHTLRHYAIWKVFVASGRCIITTRDIFDHVKAETTAKYCRSLDALEREQEIMEAAFSGRRAG